MNTITANIAFAATETNGAYDAKGVDFLFDSDIAETGETYGCADFIEWVEAEDQDAFDLGDADDVLTAKGLRRTTDWEFVGDYHQAAVEAL